MKRRLKTKLEATRKLVISALQRSTKPVVACSFGKNSMVVLHLVRRCRPDVAVLFSDTLVEYPDSYEFKERMREAWDLQMVETKPVKDFWWVARNCGLPLFTRKGPKGNTKAYRSCSRYLKEYPLENLQRREKFDLYFTGLSRHESKLREFAAKKYGGYFYSKTLKLWKCHPILEWTEDDVWDYHRHYRVPHNPIYDREAPDGFEVRTSCWSCPVPIRHGKLKFLRMNFPDLWEMLLRRGLGKLLAERKLGRSVSQRYARRLMKERPEFFDWIEDGHE